MSRSFGPPRFLGRVSKAALLLTTTCAVLTLAGIHGAQAGSYTASTKTELRNAIMRSKSPQEWYDSVDWLYGGSGIEGSFGQSRNPTVPATVAA